jgi:transcriptional regulator with XRE-family HTH domain
MSEMEWLQIFANNLVYYLEMHGISQNELARRSGLEQGSISRYMSATQMPGIKAVVNISNALGINVDELINFDSMIY